MVGVLIFARILPNTYVTFIYYRVVTFLTANTVLDLRTFSYTWFSSRRHHF